MNRIASFCLTILLTVAFLAPTAPSLAQQDKAKSRKKQPNPVYAPITDVAGLPRVLLIGDSISIGYTLAVRELLTGKANVHRPPVNCGPTIRGVEQIDAWLGDGRWDVIHFNFGLHDLKYVDETGNLVAPDKGRQVASVEQYEQNLRQIVERLKKTGARLIWASTTPVPDGSAGRVMGDEARYNAVAAKIMKDAGIAIDDLHAVVVRKPHLQMPRNVHYTPEGYQALARSVADSIEKGEKP